MAWSFSSWFTPQHAPQVDAAYIALVRQSRNPYFYETLGVPDTIDGRFEMVVLHLFFIQHRLVTEMASNPAMTEFARQLSEAFFDDMDRTTREFGVMDTGVGKRVKRMAKAYHGRLQAYSAALGDHEAMRAALIRNLYGTLGDGTLAQVDGMIDYIAHQQAALARAETSTILAGNYAWPELAGAKKISFSFTNE